MLDTWEIKKQKPQPLTVQRKVCQEEKNNTQEGTRAYGPDRAETFLLRAVQIQGRVYICKCEGSIKIN